MRMRVLTAYIVFTGHLGLDGRAYVSRQPLPTLARTCEHGTISHATDGEETETAAGYPYAA